MLDGPAQFLHSKLINGLLILRDVIGRDFSRLSLESCNLFPECRKGHLIVLFHILKLLDPLIGPIEIILQLSELLISMNVALALVAHVSIIIMPIKYD